MDTRAMIPHVVRAGFAFFMLFSISVAFFSAFGTSRTGLRFFELICGLNIVVITIAGVSWFATVVTEEKEAGTFALMRLAGITPLSITLGKSTSRLVSALMLLIVQLPFTFLAITLGGVLWRQVVASYLALAAWLILVANLGLLCSVRCVTSGRAASLATAVLLLFFFFPSIIEDYLAVRFGPAAFPQAANPAGADAVNGAQPGVPGAWVWLTAVADTLRSVSIWTRIAEVLTISQPVTLLGSQFWWNLLLAALFFAISTLRMERWVAAAGENRGSLPGHSTLRRRFIGRSWPWAVSWKEFHYFTGGRLFLTAKLLAGCALIAWFLFLEAGTSHGWAWLLTGDRAWYAFLAFVGLLTVEILVYSSGCLFSELQQGTHGVLATLPHSSIRLLLEKAAGCGLALLPALLGLLVTAWLGQASLRNILKFDQVVVFLIMLLFAAHAAALFSLFTRWAALPLTVLACLPAFFLLALPVLALSFSTQRLARSQNIQWNNVLGYGVSLLWCWLFALLPMQLMIRKRWHAVCRR